MSSEQPLGPVFLEIGNDSVEAFRPGTRTRARLPRTVASALCKLGERSSEEVPDDVRQALLRLDEIGLKPGGTSLPEPWATWGSLAWAFHERTSNIAFIRRGSKSMTSWQEDIEALEDVAPTALGNIAHCGTPLWLPRVDAHITATFTEVLQGRRSHRRFIRRSVPLEHFSTFLRYTFGAQRFVDAHELGLLELRSYIAGGARHETMACIAVLEVDRLNPGLYVYDNLRHALVPLPGHIDRGILNELTGNQGFYDDVGFGVLTVADTHKFTSKYRNARAYRHLQQNVGAYAQVASMVAHALGLGAAVTGALSDTDCASLLGLQTPRELPMFSISVGFPAIQHDGLPADMNVHSSPAEKFGIFNRSASLDQSDFGVSKGDQETRCTERSYDEHNSTIQPGEELRKLEDLRDLGIFTPEEFEAKKAKIILRASR